MPLSKQGETKAEPEGPSATRLARWIEAISAAPGPAPVHLWNPPNCGEIDIVIDRTGAWYHEGRRIEREALVRLFARVLRREADGSFVLVTPVEKLTIRVEDAPFLAVDFEFDEALGRITFLTNLGEIVPLDAAHPLRLDEGLPDAFVPYVTVRGGLEARLTRAAASSLAERAELRDGWIGVFSAGHFFVIGREEVAA